MPLIDITHVDEPGWVPDLAPEQLPPSAWTSAKNVRFVDGHAERVRGYFEGYGAPQGVARAIIQARKTDGTYTWIYAHETGVSMAVGEIHSNISLPAVTYSLLPGEKPSLLRFNDRVIINYPELPPQYFFPIDELEDAAALPFFPVDVRAKRIVGYREFLVALGVHNGTEWEHSTILWSHSAEPNQLPDSWDISDPAKDAGAYQLGESADRLMDGCVLGTKLILYKEKSVHVMEYTGYPQIHSFRPLFANRGILSAGCVVAYDDKHLVVDRGDIYVHNGATAKSILQDRHRRWFRTAIDRTYAWKTYVKHYQFQHEIWIVFPADGSAECNTALVYNYENDRLHLRTFPKLTAIGTGYLDVTDNIAWNEFTGMWVTNVDNWNTTVDLWNSFANPEQWSDFASSWDSIIGDTTCDHFLLAVGREDDPEDNVFAFCDSTGRFGNLDFYAFVERTCITLGSADQFKRPIANLHSMKMLTSVWPRVQSDGPVMVQVGSQTDVNAPVYWEAPMVFRPGVDRKVDCFVTGKLLAIRFYSDKKGYWRLSGYELDVQEMGRY